MGEYFSGSRGGREKTVSFRNARGSFLRMIINENYGGRGLVIIMMIIMIMMLMIMIMIIIMIMITGGRRGARVEGGD